MKNNTPSGSMDSVELYYQKGVNSLKYTSWKLWAMGLSVALLDSFITATVAFIMLPDHETHSAAIATIIGVSALKTISAWLRKSPIGIALDQPAAGVGQ